MILYLSIFILSFSLTLIVKYFAERKSLLDIPNERSSHTIPTPRGGGIAIVLAWFAGISFLYYQNNIDANLYYALMSGILISAISFIDDIYVLKFIPRLIIQATATIFALFFIGGLNKIDLGFYTVENSFLLSAIAFFGILWFINLFNFIDGIDGYAASEAVFVALALWFFIGDEILILLALAVIGFLPWNWDKAKIFMGDVGSTFLGFTLAILAIYYQNTEYFSILNWLILTSVFWGDATYTLLRRFINKENLSKPHKKHVYQRIVQAGFSHRKTVLWAMGMNLFLFLLAYFSTRLPFFIMIFTVINLLFLFTIKKMVDKKKPFV